jgi:hypothetical protein
VAQGVDPEFKTQSQRKKRGRKEGKKGGKKEPEIQD